MTIYSVYSKEFAPYGKVITGLDKECAEILEQLEQTPLPDAVEYTALHQGMQALPAAEAFSRNLYGGMPVQLGWCNGHNTKLNCLEYHRDSEFNLGCNDFILLLAKQEEIENGLLSTSKVKAFRVPAGVLVECYATTLHYAPCHADPGKGFKVLIALPRGTNTERPEICLLTPEDDLLFARNKWLLAHPDSSEAKNGAYVGLTGENIDIASLI